MRLPTIDATNNGRYSTEDIYINTGMLTRPVGTAVR
jgi:hypothetical protein